jgi:hypothetical protein
VSLWSVVAIIVLVTNCTGAIAIANAYGFTNGIGTAFEGDCQSVNRLSIGLHLLINALGALLLSASNYTMQVLNAPTRRECDQAHARGDWLDVGITSLRNITRISWRRRVLWVLLGVSSIPIHLLYNSAAFKTIDANEYMLVVATPKFLESDTLPPAPSQTMYHGFSADSYWNWSLQLRDVYLGDSNRFENLSTTECLNVYGVSAVTGYSNVIAAISNSTDTNLSVWYAERVQAGMDSYSWYVHSTW